MTVFDKAITDFSVLAPLKGFSAKNSPTGGFISPSSAGRRSSLLGGSGTPLGGTPNRLGGIKKEGGIKVNDRDHYIKCTEKCMTPSEDHKKKHHFPLYIETTINTF